MRSWLLLTYKVSRKPTSLRVYIWRKLQKLGALLLHDAVWVLPDKPGTEHHFQWLAAEIREMNGEAMVWRSNAAPEGSDAHLAERFTGVVSKAYGEMLRQLKRPGTDRAALARRYQQLRAMDYFDSPLSERVRKRLLIGDKKPKPRRKGIRR